jgi:hypothetical protein
MAHGALRVNSAIGSHGAVGTLVGALVAHGALEAFGEHGALGEEIADVVQKYCAIRAATDWTCFYIIRGILNGCTS